MTNQEWLCSLSAEDFLCNIKWLLKNYGKRWTDSDSAIIEWLQGKHEVNTSEDKGMTREEAIDIIKCLAWHTRPNEEDIEQAIKALEQEPCMNCISRQAVEDAIAEMTVNGESLGYAVAYDILSDLPSVTPQPKLGRWIDDKCSICGKGIEDLIDSREWYRNEEPNFCPFCGVKFVEPQESEE